MEIQEEKIQEEKEDQEFDNQSTESPVEESKEDKINPQQSIKELSEQISDLQDRLLRQMAESENIRSRSTKMVEEAREYAIFGFAKDLVPVMDNLSRALEHLPDDMDANIKNIIAGVEMTKREFESVFKTHSLESIVPQSGDKFDYNLHHAISQVETNEYKSGTIVDTMQVGYKIKDRLIRPAAVTVAKSS